MRANRLSALLPLLCFALPLSALAGPELAARLDDQPLALSWNALASDRYDIELSLAPGQLQLRKPQAGDEAVLWGEGLPVERVAEEIGTIPYELITKLTSRVFMEYV